MQHLLLQNLTYAQNLAAFNALNARMNAARGLPDGKGTVRYADPVVDQSGTAVSFPIIDSHALAQLTITEKALLISSLPPTFSKTALVKL